MTVSLTQTPVIETERLILRAPKGSDYAAWEVFATGPRAQYIGGPYTVRTAWRGWGHMIGHWTMRGFGSFVFTMRGDDAPLGTVGPYYPGDWPEPELGWTLWRDDLEGTGLAYEAAAASRDYAFDALGWDTAVSYIDIPNTRSIALAERLGAVRDDTARRPGYEGEDHAPIYVYRHPKPEAV